MQPQPLVVPDGPTAQRHRCADESNPGEEPEFAALSRAPAGRRDDAAALSQPGWFAARVGKLYHYGVPNDIGTSSLDDYRSWDLAINPRGRDREIHDRIFSLRPGQFGGTLSWLADEGEDADYTDGIGAAEAVRLLERFKRNSQPFFLAVGFYRPHTPYVAPKQYFDMYPAERIDCPRSRRPIDRGRRPPRIAAHSTSRTPRPIVSARRRSRRTTRRLRSWTHRWATCSTRSIALGSPSNTIVVFTSDHGYHLGDHGLWQKMSLFERSARVPLIIAGPAGAARGQVARGIVELVDLYPTLAALAGLTPAAPLDGVSLSPMLTNPSATVKDAAFSQARNGYAVRTDRWRYIEWDGGKEGAQLYDMENDPAETTNLAADPKHAATVADLRARLAAYPR